MYHRLKLADVKKNKVKLDHVKIEVCQSIRRIAMRNGWDQRLLARHIGTSESSVSRVIRHRVDELTLNQLFRYLAILEPNFKIQISI